MQGNATQLQNNKNMAHGFLKYLPKDPEQRTQLKQAILNFCNRLRKKYQKKAQAQLDQKIKLLDLRLLLIDSCSQMSLLRLDHLQQIFKHYCTHIFKTGKHITFERIQYEKVHLTMERFFLFVKDFEINIMKNVQKKEEVVDKNIIILFFKKISSNTRDVSFEEFIRLLQKIAVLYFDQKQVFYQKRQKLRQQKQKRKQQYEKKKMLRLKKKQNEKNNSGNQQNQENQQNQQNQQNKQQQNQEKKQNQQQIQNQNDQFIKDMLNNKDIEDPNQEINNITNRYALQQGQQTLEGDNQNNIFSQMDEDTLLYLSNQEKIQYYYKFMVKVDSVKQYRDKLTELNLPIFNKGKGNKTNQAANSYQKNIKTSQDQQARIQDLKKKIDEKKLKQKASPIPKPKDDGAWVKAQEQKQRKRQLKKQRQVHAKQKSKNQSDALLQKKLDSQKPAKQKKPQFNEKQFDWNTLGKLSIDQLKLNKFNPNRYFSKDDDDKIFLEQYEGNGRPRVSSRMDARQRNSMSVVQDVKKRIGEVEKKQKRQEKDLQKKIGQNVPIKSRF